MNSDNLMIFLVGGGSIAIGLYIIFSYLFGKNKQFSNGRQIIGAVCIIFFGALFSVAVYLDNIGLMTSSFAFSFGCGFIAFGIYNFVLCTTCTYKTTATYLYSQSVGKRGENAIPVFRYTYEGEEYTCSAKQSVSSKFIGTIYRTNQPCQIFINPDKPKNNLVRIGKTINEIGKIIIGVILVVGAFAALYFL